MSLIDAFKSACILMEKTRVSDGEGGWNTVWKEGVEFEAAITFDSTMQARIAEKDGVSSLYTVTTSKNTSLDFHDVFKRVSDGKVFRVTSDSEDKRTPNVASFEFEQVSAEEWSLTDGN